MSDAGWFWPVNSRKAHFYKEGDDTSVCGKWLVFSSVREQGNDNSSDNCAACKKRLAKLNARNKPQELHDSDCGCYTCEAQRS
jgi:hypothetical protein